MTLHCHACSRRLVRYAVSNFGADGVEYGWGPVCAKAVLVTASRAERPRVAVRRDRLTRDWVNEQRAGARGG